MTRPVKTTRAEKRANPAGKAKKSALAATGERAPRAAEERSLVARARGGDSSAFEALLRLYEKPVYNLAFRMLRNREEAADVLQEASFNAYRALPRFMEKSSFGTWFYRIAANQCLMKIRERKKSTLSLESVMSTRNSDGEETQLEIPDWSNNPAASFENTELKAILEKSIAELPPTYRVVFVMYEMEDLRVKEISRILKISESAVKTRLHRGRLILREKLSRYFDHLKQRKPPQG